MKTLKIITLFVVSMAIAVGVSAARPGDQTKNPAELTKIVTTLVAYPEFAVQRQITGYVVTELKVNTDGTISIEKINATQPELREYVLQKLDNAKVKVPQEIGGKTYYYRFDFQLL